MLQKNIIAKKPTWLKNAKTLWEVTLLSVFRGFE